MNTENQNIEWKESWRDEYLKWICGFANAQGGVLNIGIDDSGNVVGLKDIKTLLEEIPNKIVALLGIVADVNRVDKDGKSYVEIVVPKSNMPIAYKGIYHYRSGSTKQELRGQALQDFLLRKLGMTWDDMAEERATIDDINPDAVAYFQKMSVLNNRMDKDAVSDNIETVLGNLNLLTEDGKLKKAAVLLFGKNPSKFAPLPIFRIGRFKKNDADLIFQDSIECDLISMASRVMEVLKSKYLISPIRYEGLVRIEDLEIPEEALREAIYNAIIHKDYTGAHIQMKVWDDHIDIWNDGGLPFDMTIEKLMGQHRSKPRNTNIASVFYKAGFIESWGRGISKITDGFAAAGLKAPEFKEDCGGMLVTLYRSTKVSANDTLNDTLKDTLENRVLQSIKSNPNITQSIMADTLGVSVITIKRVIRQMTDNNIISREGGKRYGHWIINNP